MGATAGAQVHGLMDDYVSHTSTCALILTTRVVLCGATHQVSGGGAYPRQAGDALQLCHGKKSQPTQLNGWDCGVFMFVAVLQLSRGNRLSFKQQQMDSLRGRLLLALAEKDPTLLQ